MSVLLAVENLHIAAGALPLVQDVSFALHRGETLALVGESGSGKSLTALSLSGLLPEPGVRLVGGRIRLGGADIARSRESQWRAIRGRAIATIFQEPLSALNPVMSIGAQMREAIRAFAKTSDREANRRAVELLRLVRISDPERRLGQYPHQLSGGMRQRVLIAMAIAAEPQVLIADEPTTALDASIQGEILDVLRDLQRRFGLAILLITHDVGVVAEYASNVAVMYAGRIVESGSAQDVLGAPLHPYTQGLLEARAGGRRRAAGERLRLQEIRGAVASASEAGAGCAFFPRCSRAAPDCAIARPAAHEAAPGRVVACFRVAEAV